jgi:hypothetical protein
MPRFTDTAKTATVELAQGVPVAPVQTSTMAPVQPLGAGAAFGGTAISQNMGPGAPSTGGSDSGISGNVGLVPPSVIQHVAGTDEPRSQTPNQLPQPKRMAAPGAKDAFTPPNKPSANAASVAGPKAPAPAKPTMLAPKKSSAWLYPLKTATVLAPPSQGILSHINEALGVHPQMFGPGVTGNVLGKLELVNRGTQLFNAPQQVADMAQWVGDKVVGTPATDRLRAYKDAAFGVPTEPLPPGTMPQSPMSGFSDIIEPLKHPIDSTKKFISGLGDEADRQLTLSMVERPVDAHQLMYQVHPKITN